MSDRPDYPAIIPMISYEDPGEAADWLVRTSPTGTVVSGRGPRGAPVDVRPTG